MFRRHATPDRHEHAELLEEGTRHTEVIAPVPAATTELPRVSDDPVTEIITITTGPTTVVQSTVQTQHTRHDAVGPLPEIRVPPVPMSAPDVSMTLASPQPVPPRPAASTRAPRHRHRRPPTPPVPGSWRVTLDDVARDPMSLVYFLGLVITGVLVCWGTTVLLKPEWVPPAINPRAPATTEPARDRQMPRHAPVAPPRSHGNGNPDPFPTRKPIAPLRPAEPSPGTSRNPEPAPSPSGTPEPTDPPGTPEPSAPPTTGPEPSPTPTSPAEPEPTPEPTASATRTAQPTAEPTATQPSAEPTLTREPEPGPTSVAPTRSQSQEPPAIPSQDPITPTAGPSAEPS